LTTDDRNACPHGAETTENIAFEDGRVQQIRTNSAKALPQLTLPPQPGRLAHYLHLEASIKQIRSNALPTVIHAQHSEINASAAQWDS
jgi:hypothetical protein